MLLAIDTSLGTNVAVVDRDRGVLVEVSETDRTSHAMAIGDLLKRALKLSGVDPDALSGVALGIGPGPRCRLDVGISAAHGFAAALGKPVVRVMSHDAVMLERPHPALIVTNAGDNLIAWTAYDAPDHELGLPVRVGEPVFIPSGDRIQAGAHLGVERIAVSAISAGAVGMLAERLFAGGRPFARTEPYYA